MPRDGSDASFLQRVEEYNDGERDENPFEEIDRWKLWTAVGGLFAAVGLGFWLLATGSPGAAFLVFVAPFVAAGTLTKSGREAVAELAREFESELQEQSGGSTGSEPTRVCSECGWQNPRSNNYCHDCGSKLRTEG